MGWFLCPFVPTVSSTIIASYIIPENNLCSGALTHRCGREQNCSDWTSDVGAKVEEFARAAHTVPKCLPERALNHRIATKTFCAWTSFIGKFQAQF